MRPLFLLSDVVIKITSARSKWCECEHKEGVGKPTAGHLHPLITHRMGPFGWHQVTLCNPTTEWPMGMLEAAGDLIKEAWEVDLFRFHRE